MGKFVYNLIMGKGSFPAAPVPETKVNDLAENGITIVAISNQCVSEIHSLVLENRQGFQDCRDTFFCCQPGNC